MTVEALLSIFSQRIAPFWSAQPQDVRRSLERLVDAELVRTEENEDCRSAGRTTYRTTCLGRAVVDDWMKSDPETYPCRSVFLVRLAVAAHQGPQAVRSVLTDRIDTVAERLTILQHVEQDQRLATGNSQTPLETSLAMATTDHLITLAQAEINWAARCRDQVPEPPDR